MHQGSTSPRHRLWDCCMRAAAATAVVAAANAASAYGSYISRVARGVRLGIDAKSIVPDEKKKSVV